MWHENWRESFQKSMYIPWYLSSGIYSSRSLVVVVVVVVVGWGGGGSSVDMRVGGGVRVGVYRVVAGMGITNFTMVVPTVQSSRAGGWSGGQDAREDYRTRSFGC